MLSEIRIDDVLKLVLILIMFSVGLSLKLRDFKYVLNHSYLLLTGLLIKMILFPLVGFFIVELSSLSDDFKLGIFILLICPGGTTSNVITYWLNGTAALTIFLTTLSSLIAVFTIPILVNVVGNYLYGATNEFILPLRTAIPNIVIIIIIPTLIGLLANHYYPKFSKFIEKILKPFSVILLALVFIVKFLAKEHSGGTEISMNDINTLFPILLIINITGILLGFLISKWLKFNNKDSMTLGIEMGLQNVGLAILIGSVLLGNQALVKPSLIYALFTFWSSALFGLIVKRKYYHEKWT